MSSEADAELHSIEKFRDLVRDFDDAMLVSLDRQGRLHGRPMRVVGHQREQADDLWFVTGVNAEKLAEIRANPAVAVTMADGKRFVSISAEARVVTDPAKIESLWQESWKLWFPDGPRAGGIALIQALPQRAEYWDQSFPHGIRFALSAAKAWIANEAIEEPDRPEQHAKIDLE
ncbi:MAG TPA: pyridoxamine 5'-phosphate oxidase family protein [Enhygromyxa sp.]|nr:pyridoxamine 5'-phosphate oxidase family protein [Enhygromyxa sp.]